MKGRWVWSIILCSFFFLFLSFHILLIICIHYVHHVCHPEEVLVDICVVLHFPSSLMFNHSLTIHIIEKTTMIPNSIWISVAWWAARRSCEMRDIWNFSSGRCARRWGGNVRATKDCKSLFRPQQSVSRESWPSGPNTPKSYGQGLGPLP